jgi:sulfur-carrier protein
MSNKTMKKKNSEQDNNLNNKLSNISQDNVNNQHQVEITVKLFATLREGRFNQKDCGYPSGITVGRIIEELNIPPDQAAIIFVNNRHASPKKELLDGDVLAIFPPIGGG